MSVNCPWLIRRNQDMEFAGIMIQNLNNNLITAPELADLRKRLRNLESKVSRPLQSISSRQNLTFYRRGKPSSSRCSALGAATLSRLSPYASSLKHMSKHTIFCRYCEYFFR